MVNYAPKSMSELYKALSELTPKSKVISGGTDLIIRLHQKSCIPDALLYTGGIEELSKIEVKDNNLVIGATATMTEIENSTTIPPCFYAIKDAACDVGSKQIRNNGTIGGNVGNASPAGDLIPVLWLLDANVEIAGAKGLRYEPIQNVVLSPGKLSLGYNEVITRFIIKMPTKDEEFSTAFCKLGSRSKVTISRIGVTALVKTKGGIVENAKVVAGAISIKPVLVEGAEKALIGNKISEQVKLNASKALSDLIFEITPKEFDRDYKVSASKGVMCDMITLIEKRL